MRRVRFLFEQRIKAMTNNTITPEQITELRRLHSDVAPGVYVWRNDFDALMKAIPALLASAERLAKLDRMGKTGTVNSILALPADDLRAFIASLLSSEHEAKRRVAELEKALHLERDQSTWDSV